MVPDAYVQLQFIGNLRNLILVNIALANWCPVQSIVQTQKRGKKGPDIGSLDCRDNERTYMLFVIGLVSVLSDPMDLMFGVPSTLKILLVLPIIAALLTISASIFMFLAWIKRYWSGCARLHYTLVVLASLAFIWFLNYWNLLGFRF